ncbi:MAG: ABC transporter ATP-binding protein [Planctomycetes bacterium]|nr:ABC transporter ATP-binding protein [Planctomycetota bacterium]
MQLHLRVSILVVVGVRLEHLTVRYGVHLAVDDLTTEFGPGAVALLGRNGAGKSSVLRALLGLVRPASGRVRFLDLPPDADATVIRRHVGYMPEREAQVPGASAFDQVALLGSLSGLERRTSWRRAHEVLYLVGLGEQRYRPVAGYSAGMRQKAKLAGALVHDPKVVFLDEPTNGLDPAGRDEMLRLIRQLAVEFGKSIVFSTHILTDVASVCRAAVVIDHGRIVAQGTLEELTSGEAHRYAVTVEDADGSLPARLAKLGSATQCGVGRFTVHLGSGVGVDGVYRAVFEAGGVVTGLEHLRRTLEEVFLHAVAARGAR